MSELVKKLEQTSRGNDQPIGFGQKARPKNLPMILIAQLAQVEADAVKQAATGGADAILFDIEQPQNRIDEFSSLKDAIGQLPWGIRLYTPGLEQLEKLIEAGCDYLWVNSDVSAAMLGEENLARVFEVDTSIDDGLAGAIDSLSVDALYIVDSNRSSPFTIGQLLNYQRIYALACKPALADYTDNVSDLEGLLEAGVKGVLIRLDGENIINRVTEARENIRNLISKKHHRKEKAG